MYSVVGADGAVYGPVDMATIHAWIGQGRVTPNTSLIEPLSGRVVLAGQCVDLAGAFPPTSPPVANQGPVSQIGAGFDAALGLGRPASPMTPASGYAAYPHMGGYGVPVSSRSKVAAILLAFFLGGLGIHRFYLGYNGIGIAMLLFCVLTCGWGGIITGLVAIVDIILIATGSLKDVEGRPLAN